MILLRVFMFLLRVLVIVPGIYLWRRLLLPYRLVLIQVVLAFSVELYGWHLSVHLHRNNLWLYNLYLLPEVWLLGLACSYYIRNKLAGRAIVISLLFISIFWAISTYWLGIQTLNNWSVLLAALFYIVFYSIVLYRIAVFSDKKIYHQPVFYIALGILIHYAAIIPLFGLLNYLVAKDMQLSLKLFYINQVAASIRYALIATAFYLYAREVKRIHVPG